MSSFAAERFDDAFKCDQSATSFFTDLVQRNLIKIPPSTTNDQSISFFETTTPATVFGMQVVLVLGYVPGQAMFVTRPVVATERFGVVVKEGIANVQAQLNSMGAMKAKTRRFDSQTTAISCEVN